MHRLLLTAVLAIGACEQRPPIPITYVPQAPTPAADGTAAQQESRRLNRAMNQETRQDRAEDADVNGATISAMPTTSTDLDVGANDVGADVPQIGIPVGGL